MNPGDPFRGLLFPSDATATSQSHHSSIGGGFRSPSQTHSGSSDVLGKNKKTRKARTAFSDHQLNELERTFERQKYLSVQDRMQLAEKLHLSDMQVKTWYQNRRTKWKRQASVGIELLTEATHSVNRLLHQHHQHQELSATSSSSSPSMLWTPHSPFEPLSILMKSGDVPKLAAPPPPPPPPAADLLTLLATNRLEASSLPAHPQGGLDLLKCFSLLPQQSPTKHTSSVRDAPNPKTFERFTTR
ncbi:unnamed protein product [Mesocestoides corti]|uniref:Homeobox domain-containing protein n=1 Tax=Mesocestoides corti TaxID=53468 RepID=A0A3P6GNW7_MESCO|nr:unnamed protein product [Mesocestoides corti]